MNKLQLTKRDQELLMDLYNHQFLSFYQIKERHFKDNKNPTIFNRLSKLRSSKIIEKESVNVAVHHRNYELVKCVYLLGVQGIKKLQEFNFNLEAPSSKVALNYSNLYHDLLLTDALVKLKSHYPDYILLNQRSFNFDKDKVSRIPDAVLIHPTTGEQIAIELELTSKSDRRYQDIILSYRMSPFNKIIYLVRNIAIQRKIAGVITGFKSRYQLGDSTGAFSFLNLHDLLTNHLDKGE
jgi:hypothetical protein